jgi:hypothetical protein
VKEVGLFVQVPVVAVNVWPTCAVPEIVGTELFAGMTVIWHLHKKNHRRLARLVSQGRCVGAPRLSTSHEIDPATQETILSGYTSKGILTINEARAALGRAPLAEASADRPMTLTNAGFVALPE